ncbi:MAG: hypothetical protein GQ559_08010, partial [Desulfobulbaceae bacterium]|nr:hypothetical protein [Desulfobulbaceae bacterium]
MPLTNQEIGSLEFLKNLSPFERFLLQFISIIYEPVSVTFLNRVLAKADLSFSDDHRPGKVEIQAAIVKLHTLQLLDSLNQCPRVLAELLTREAVNDGRFSAMAALVEKEAPVSYSHGKWSTRCWRALRQFRFGVYGQDFDKIDEA